MYVATPYVYASLVFKYTNYHMLYHTFYLKEAAFATVYTKLQDDMKHAEWTAPAFS